MALTLLLTAAALAAAAPDLAEMTRVADAFDQAQINKDRPTLERMVDDELVFITAAGQRSDKKAFIDGWTAPDDRYDPVTLVDRTMTGLGSDAFIVSAETELGGTSGGKAFKSRFRFSDTFRRTNGQWKAVHIQVTRIGD